jgi:hypothetical protein
MDREMPPFPAAADRPLRPPGPIEGPAALRRRLRATPHLLQALQAVAALRLPDAWIGAGALRDLVWDAAHGRPPARPNDIDVAYFDPADPDPAAERRITAALAARAPGLPWQVRNQARMHRKHGHAPYPGTAAAVATWVETATAVAARLDPAGEIALLAPHGLDDLFGLVLRPVPAQGPDAPDFWARLAAKRWTDRWPRLRLYGPPGSTAPSP